MFDAEQEVDAAKLMLSNFGKPENLIAGEIIYVYKLGKPTEISIGISFNLKPGKEPKDPK